MKNNYIGQGWLILLLSVLFGAALSGVQMTLSGKIDDNKKADTMSQIPELVPGAVGGTPEQHGDYLAYRATNSAGALVGWVIAASGQGFADKIETLVGVNADVSKITGLYVLFQNETPGLGNKITDSGDGSYRSQFQGKEAATPLVVTKDGSGAPDNNKIDAVTGATISSESCVDIVNKAVTGFKAQLGGNKS